MKQGVLVYDQQSDRMDVKIGSKWKPTRIEYNWGEKEGWYLVDVPVESLVGLTVRMD